MQSNLATWGRGPRSDLPRNLFRHYRTCRNHTNPLRPKNISYETLLDWLWRSHDPALNRQGADIGTQYRSAIFYHNEAQREAAKASKAAAQRDFTAPIVTEITAAGTYYPAEDYHQDYYRQNPNAPYCQIVIRPKLEKLALE